MNRCCSTSIASLSHLLNDWALVKFMTATANTKREKCQKKREEYSQWTSQCVCVHLSYRCRRRSHRHRLCFVDDEDDFFSLYSIRLSFSRLCERMCYALVCVFISLDCCHLWLPCIFVWMKKIFNDLFVYIEKSMFSFVSLYRCLVVKTIGTTTIHAIFFFYFFFFPAVFNQVRFSSVQLITSADIRFLYFCITSYTYTQTHAYGLPM